MGPGLGSLARQDPGSWLAQGVRGGCSSLRPATAAGLAAPLLCLPCFVRSSFCGSAWPGPTSQGLSSRITCRCAPHRSAYSPPCSITLVFHRTWVPSLSSCPCFLFPLLLPDLTRPTVVRSLPSNATPRCPRGAWGIAPFACQPVLRPVATHMQWQACQAAARLSTAHGQEPEGNRGGVK